jgi:hypothetical protein
MRVNVDSGRNESASSTLNRSAISPFIIKDLFGWLTFPFSM